MAEIQDVLKIMEYFLDKKIDLYTTIGGTYYAMYNGTRICVIGKKYNINTDLETMCILCDTFRQRHD